MPKYHNRLHSAKGIKEKWWAQRDWNTRLKITRPFNSRDPFYCDKINRLYYEQFGSSFWQKPYFRTGEMTNQLAYQGSSFMILI